MATCRSGTKGNRFADAGIRDVALALPGTTLGWEHRAKDFELRQGQPARMSSIEELKACHCGRSEFLAGDRPVEVRVGCRNGFGKIEQGIPRSTL